MMVFQCVDFVRSVPMKLKFCDTLFGNSRISKDAKERITAARMVYELDSA